MKCTVLISLYNAEKTLDRTFESLNAQTFQDFRIIAINDHSNDDTLRLLEKWRDIFGEIRFTIIDNETNIGLTKSLNKGLSSIKEAYAARIDADDWWHPEKLEKQIAFLEHSLNHGIIGCNYINMANGQERQIVLPETDETIKKDMLRRNPFAHSCVVFRTDIIRNIGGYDENIRYGQDYELWLRCSLKTKFHNIQELLCFRNAESGISFEKQNEQMLQCLKTQMHYIRELHRSPFEYRFILEPLVVLLTPAFIRDLKRKFL